MALALVGGMIHMSGTETAPALTTSTERERLTQHYQEVRRFSAALCAPLHPEDMVVQTSVEVSPTKWHLAHTSWFFETFVLREAVENYENPVPEYAYLFNSYYQAAGPMHCRAQRGLVSRPTVDQVMHYREQVDLKMLEFLRSASDADFDAWQSVIRTGLHHENQHQELMLTDIKNVFARNPLYPAYDAALPVGTPEGGMSGPVEWIEYPGGLVDVGFSGNGFHYDNECPSHKVYLQPFALADRPVTNREYMEFIEDGGYERPEFWLSLGWMTVSEQGWIAPLYWEKQGDGWKQFTLGGLRDVDPDEPVCHVSYFEASAFARWARARLPGEHEWEIAAKQQAVEGNFVDTNRLHPAPGPTADTGPLRQLYGDVWEWTRSSYAPYPGYEAEFGALGEYNGKFMCNQYVLRGGSCATVRSHMRPTYRNFFQPDKRWQFSGIRLAKDLVG